MNVTKQVLLITILAILSAACSEGVRRRGIPLDAKAVLETAIADIDAGRYEKLYNEAAEEWRRESTLEQSQTTFQTLREKLGNVRTRNLQTAREQDTSSGAIPGHSLVATYQVSFDKDQGTPPQPITGMETFTLLERGGRWYLARYFVTSDDLK